MRCAACDRVNAADYRFCVDCGAPLAYANPPAWAQAAARGGAPAVAPPDRQAVAPGPGYAPGFAPDYAPGYATGTYAAYPGYAPPAPAYAYPPGLQIVNNVNVSAAAVPAPTPVVVLGQDAGPNLFVRALWFLFIGLWLGALCTVLGWLLNLTIVGLPLGLYIINRLPRIMTLKPVASHLRVTMHNGVAVVHRAPAPQAPFALRALYFVLVGSWASLLWLLIAWVLVAATLGLGLPLAFWMFDRVPAVTTLAR